MLWGSKEVGVIADSPTEAIVALHRIGGKEGGGGGGGLILLWGSKEVGVIADSPTEAIMTLHRSRGKEGGWGGRGGGGVNGFGVLWKWEESLIPL